MKINLEINNKSKSPIEDSFFVSVAEKTLKDLKFEKDISISLALVSPEEMRELNSQYRSHDEVTDVLSFPEYKNISKISEAVDKIPFLGEIILCYDDIRGYSEKEKIKLEKELAKVFSHGILHLLGYSHGTEMFNIQEKVSENFK